MGQLLLKSLTSGRATPARHPLGRCPPPACLAQSSSAVLFHLSKVLPVSPASSRAPCGTGWPGPVSPRLLGRPPPPVRQQPPLSPFTHSLPRAFIHQCFRGHLLNSPERKRCHRAWAPGPPWATEGRAGDLCVHLSFCIQPAATSSGCGETCELGMGGWSSGFVGWVEVRQTPPPWVPPEPAPRGALRGRLGSKELIHTTGHPETRVRKL